MSHGRRFSFGNEPEACCLLPIAFVQNIDDPIGGLSREIGMIRER